jgi:ureidoacrylate peracid hydrolase
MHPVTLPAPIAERLQARRGRLTVFDTLDPARTALVVIDMQRAFMDPGAPSETPAAREIVPNINRLAAALRRRGGTVAWVQAAFERGDWPLFFDWMVTPAISEAVLAALTQGSPMHELWPELDVQLTDIRVKKKRYSAFFPEGCPLPALLRSRQIETVIVTGCLTNVCCEASARDAMMAGWKVFMPADANAARSDEEHVWALASIAQFFGDVRVTDEVLALIG